ncbi:MAG: GNAT family N-acetyltransferase [Thermoleophilaceae bacterium]
MRPLPAGIALRPATGDDAEPIALILDEGIAGYASFAPDGWAPPEVSADQERALARRFDGREAWGLLAYAGDDPVALVSLSKVVRSDVMPAPPGSGYLWHMFVRPQWQGSGLAGALLDLALAEARERGWRRLILWAAAGQAQARRFYEREGFAPTGRTQFNAEIGLELVQYAADV